MRKALEQPKGEGRSGGREVSDGGRGHVSTGAIKRWDEGRK